MVHFSEPASRDRLIRLVNKPFLNREKNKMWPKYLIFSVIAVTVVFTISDSHRNKVKRSDYSHDLIVGTRQPDDVKLLSKLVFKKPQTIDRKIIFTKRFFANRHRITQLRVLDQKNDGTAAFVSLIRGGLNHNNATLRFIGQRGSEINFRVEIYGKKL